MRRRLDMPPGRFSVFEGLIWKGGKHNSLGDVDNALDC